MNNGEDILQPHPVVLVIGPFPPPLHGAALITERLAQSLRKRVNVKTVNLSSGRLGRNLIYHCMRIARVCVAFSIILKYSRKVKSIYFSLSGGMGQIYDAVLIATARMLRLKIFLHHHSYAYLGKRALCLAMIARAAGPRATHICLCSDMAAKLKALYPEVNRGVTLSNAALVGAPQPLSRGCKQTVVLGHLGNLLPEKGTDAVLEVFRRCRAMGLPTQLVLAGPMPDPKIQTMVLDTSAEFGSSFQYRGPAYGEDKNRFFRDIDIFLLPSRYRNEAQPLVVLEALAAGVPVIASARGCIGDDVGDAGLVVLENEDFVARALAIISNYAGSPAAMMQASKRATERAMALFEGSQHDLQELMRQLVR